MINHTDEDYEYPSSGSEYHKRNYQDSVVKQTSGGKVHVTVTYPSSSPELTLFSAAADVNLKSQPILERSASSMSSNTPQIDENCLDTISHTKTIRSAEMEYSALKKNGDSDNDHNREDHLRSSCTDDGGDNSGNHYNNNNGFGENSPKAGCQDIANGVNSSSDESTCYKRDLNVKQRSDHNNSDLEQTMDSRRLTVDSGICLCGNETDMPEKQISTTGSGSVIAATSSKSHLPLDQGQ